MSRVEAAAAMDRLPWLPDDPAPRPVRRPVRRRLGAGLAGAAAIAGIALWFGVHRVEQPPPPLPQARPTTTVRLPAARPPALVQPQVKLSPVPEIEPMVAPPMPVIDTPRPVRRTPEKTVAEPAQASEPAPPAVEAPAPAPARVEPLQPWPVRVIDGASGRLVRIGAFLTPHQAKRGWWAIVRMNPALKRLPALVVPVQSLRNGRVYYRLQMGTTSQAHSAVLCQRMRMIAQPCVVIGVTAG